MKQPYKSVEYVFYYAQSFQPTDNNFSLVSIPWNPLSFIPEEQNVLIKKINASWTTIERGLAPGSRAIKSWKVLFRYLDKMGNPLQTIHGLVQNSNSGPFINPINPIEKFTSLNSYKPINNFNPGIIAGGIEINYLEWSFFDIGIISSFLEYNLRISIYYQDIDEKKNLLC